MEPFGIVDNSSEMGIKSYQKMNELLNVLKEKIDKLNEGKLSLEELDELSETGRELYERLIVLRHKAREEFAGERSEKEDVVETEKTEAEEEEASPVVEDSKDEKEEEIEQPAFNFTIDDSEPIEDISSKSDEQVETEESPEEDTVEENEEVVEETNSSEVSEQEDDTQTEEEKTLKDKLGVDDPLSLRKKLQRTPLDDLQEEITIARKFEYIKVMFDGDTEAYDEAIKTLNSGEDANAAREKLNEYSEKFNWNLENKAIIKFIELVERRHL